MQELDGQDEDHAAWWEALLLICDEELKEASRQEAADRAKFKGEQLQETRRAREVGVHSAVDAEIQNLLSGAALIPQEPMCNIGTLQMHAWCVCHADVTLCRR